MPDIIQILPNTVANQIAAGEVIQRPASSVKELMENATDSGADRIQLIVKDAGKSLVQVIDNGCGMSVNDARKCFERHATSKIRQATDLFAIRTMGFRGEALASIAAIAQVELTTRRHEDELGTSICVEDSEVISQHPCAAPTGTSVVVKNLFYNTPARRNFLKSNAIEMRHIVDEFQRITLSHPLISFSMHHNQQELYRLPTATLKQRIVHLFGSNYNERLVPVAEDTSIIKLQGFVGKPEYARKTRGEQFLFVNNRFIKDAYLNHAVMTAFKDVLMDSSFPFYALFINIDPSKIDINVHPTKNEIKFQDEKSIYAIICSSVKRSLGRYNITPSLDFNREVGLEQMITDKPLDQIEAPKATLNTDFDPFNATDSKHSQSTSSSSVHPKPAVPPVLGNWESLYEIVQHNPTTQQRLVIPDSTAKVVEEQTLSKLPEERFFQIHNHFILSTIKSGFMLIDQQAAHERVLYEQFLNQLENGSGVCQQSLFPQTITFTQADFDLLESLLPDIRNWGFDIRKFGKNTVIVEGIPIDARQDQEQGILEQLLENYKNALSLPQTDKKINLAKAMAKNVATKSGTKLSLEEMQGLVDQLFACKAPNVSLNGKPIVVTFTLEALFKKFEQTTRT